MKVNTIAIVEDESFGGPAKRNSLSLCDVNSRRAKRKLRFCKMNTKRERVGIFGRSRISLLES